MTTKKHKCIYKKYKKNSCMLKGTFNVITDLLHHFLKHELGIIICVYVLIFIFNLCRKL